jgi:mono/diheme cytochrome c family protein
MLNVRDAVLSACAVTAVLLGALAGCRAPDAATHNSAPADAADASAGAVHYGVYCAACHRPDGTGTPAVAPPLARSPWVRGSPARLTRIVLHGLRGPIEIDGTTYDMEMLPFGPIMTDQQIADLLTYVRATFGPGSEPITPAAVAAIRAATADRADYWTVPELQAIP